MTDLSSQQIRGQFLDFFEKKGHKIVPSFSLIPLDPSVLLTSAGMQQFVLYLEGKKDPLKDFGTWYLTSCQKCFRTADINEVGDDIHHTFFEMLGNWSIGEDSNKGYFKEEAIDLALEFLVDTLELDKDKFWITVFKGGNNIPKDEESIKIWQEKGIPKERIKEFGMEDNFWGPIGEVGVCGPCSEIHYDRGKEFGCQKPDCRPNCKKCNRFIEIWNLVFMEYNKNAKCQMPNAKCYNYTLLPQRNVDTGMGIERLTAVLQNKPSGYETDLFWPIIKNIQKISSKKYKEEKRIFRILADHLRGSVFLIGDGILPSNLDRGYILRRILRRTIRYAKVLNLPENWYVSSIKKLSEIYGSTYFELRTKETEIITVFQNEEEKFGRALDKGLSQFDKLLKRKRKSGKRKIISGLEGFSLYSSFSVPIDLIQELAKERGFEIDIKGFEKALKEHQKISRAGAEKKFGGLGLEKVKDKRQKVKVIKLHTATHLLQQALRDVLGDQVKQMGSDINEERLRFDFSYDKKLTPEQIKKVEEIVNQKIKENLPVKKNEMDYQQALKSGALAFFKERYPEKVTVYFIGDSLEKSYSKEICAGHHINRTGELGQFKIVKEESSGAGVRRIKATLES